MSNGDGGDGELVHVDKCNLIVGFLEIISEILREKSSLSFL